jgi:hypothetical protein
LIFVQGKRHGSSFSFLYAQVKKLSFPTICFICLCQKSRSCSCMDLYLGLLFCSTDVHVFLC